MSKSTQDLPEPINTAELTVTSCVDQDFHFHPTESQCPLDDTDLPIHKASYKGEIASLASLIATCEDIDARNSYGCTSLHLAIRGNHAEAVSLLLSAGADPTLKDVADSAAFDALNLAAWMGAQHAMGALIDAGLKIPAPAIVFERCASLNAVNCMQIILDRLSKDEFSDGSRRGALRTALGRAACCWHVEAVEFLLTAVNSFPNRDILEDRMALSDALAFAVDLEFLCVEECRSMPTENDDRLDVIMEKLIAAGAVANPERRGARWSAFWVAAGDPQTTRFLIEHGLRHDSQTDKGHTPLFAVVSVQIEDSRLLKEFIAAGADVHHTDRALRTPMHYAASRIIAEILHHHGAAPFEKDEDGMTPLHLACISRRLDVIQFLLSKGATVDEASRTGWTPLLCSTGAPVDHFKSYPDWPIHDTETASRLDLAKVLLDRGANIRATTTDGRTVLHGAARLNDTELVRYFINHGANARDAIANVATPLHEATRKSNLDIVRYLIDHGANVHAVDANNDTALHEAAIRSNFDIVRYLIDHGADVQTVNADADTPLHKAAHASNFEMIQYLVDHGADVRAVNAKGETALYISAGAASVEIVQYLIDQGADVHGVTTESKTVLHRACMEAVSSQLPSVTSTLAILLDKGVDVNAKDIAGSTALHLLYTRCYRNWPFETEAFNLLLRRGADRLIEDIEGDIVKELVEKDDKWDWDEEGLLKMKRSVRDAHYRWRGRGCGRRA